MNNLELTRIEKLFEDCNNKGFNLQRRSAAVIAGFDLIAEVKRLQCEVSLWKTKRAPWFDHEGELLPEDENPSGLVILGDDEDDE